MKQEDIDALESLGEDGAAEGRRYAAAMKELDCKIRAIERRCDHKFPDGSSAICDAKYDNMYDNQCDLCGCEGMNRP